MSGLAAPPHLAPTPDAVSWQQACGAQRLGGSEPLLREGGRLLELPRPHSTAVPSC